MFYHHLYQQFSKTKYQLSFLMVLSLSILMSCTPGKGSAPAQQALSSPFGEKISVEKDNQGNFMAVYRDGVSIYATDYEQGVRKTPFRVATGDNPDLAVSKDGEHIYVTYNADTLVSGNTRQRVYSRVYKRSQDVWSDPIKESSTNILYFNGDSIKPKTDVFDDLLVMANSVNYSTLDFYERITTSAGTSTYPFYRVMNGFSGGGVYKHFGWFNGMTQTYKPPVNVVGGVSRGPLSIYSTLVAIASNHQGMMLWSQQTDGRTTSDGFSEQSGLFVKPFSGQKSKQRFHEQEYAHDGQLVLLSDANIKEGGYKLAMAANGDAVVIWNQEIKGLAPDLVNRNGIYKAHYDAATKTWSQSQLFVNTVQNFTNESSIIDLAVDDNGNAFALWTNPTTGLKRMKYNASTQIWENETTVDSLGKA